MSEVSQRLKISKFQFSFQTFFETKKIKDTNILVLIVSTYTDGQPPANAAWFFKYVTEMACDFRYQKDALKGLKFAVCGLGNSLYTENFNKVAAELDRSLSQMKATRVTPMYLCDENTLKAKHSSLEGDFEFWSNNFVQDVEKLVKTNRAGMNGSCCRGGENQAGECCQNNQDKNETCSNQSFSEEEEEEKFEDTTEDEDGDNDEEGVILSDMGEDEDNEEGKIKKQPNGLVDMEDLGKVINGMKTKRGKKNADAQPKEMITPLLRKSLEKQGYKLIGTHSGVKLCRWTKSMLRGRGGCYKHTFYGIESHRCMETTPSLACGI